MPKNSKEYQRDYREKRKDAPAAQRIVAEMERRYKDTRKLLEDAMSKCVVGTSAYLRHVEAISDLDRRHREELVSRGLQPESLGTAARQGWHFVAHVSVQGNANVIEVPESEVQAVLAKRAKDDAARLAKMAQPGDAEARVALDAEFGFTPKSEENDE